MRFFVGVFFGAILSLITFMYLYPKMAYRNNFDFTNGSIRIQEGIEGRHEFSDIPAKIDIRVSQVRANKYGVCDIKTGKQEMGYISLEHLNMLDHFAYRYLERKNDSWHGGSRLVIDGKEVEGKELK